MRISIIIPVYCVENYIERCITSVLNQTYKNLEVILIDDCSPDKSMEIAKKISQERGQHIKFVFLRQEENKGQSAARNRGLKVATGDYVYFLDSDDEITSDCIETLVKPLESRRYDVVSGSFNNYSEKNVFHKNADKALDEHDDILTAFLKGELNAFTCNKLCNFRFLKDNGLFFEEGILHEDALWNFELVLKASCVYISNKPTYQYLIRDDSSSRSKEKIQKRTDSLKIVIKEMYLFQIRNGYLSFPTDCAIRKFLPLFEDTSRMLPSFSLWKYYQQVCKADCRTMEQKKKVYQTIAQKIRYLDFFLPVSIGFCFRYLQWTLVKIKARSGKIPFVY